jgi:lauroyl/myristoyl acyltransferase
VHLVIIDALIPTIVGGILAIAGGFLAKVYSDLREKKNLQVALAAEIRSFLNVLERENLTQFLRDTLARIEKEKRLPLFPVSFRTTYSTVFSGAASKMGYLDACLLNEVVSYYYKVQMLVEFGDVFSANLTDICNRHAEEDPEEIREQVETLEEMIKITAEVRESAIQLVNKLDPA